jgi:hypothetical protein
MCRLEQLLFLLQGPALQATLNVLELVLLYREEQESRLTLIDWLPLVFASLDQE